MERGVSMTPLEALWLCAAVFSFFILIVYLIGTWNHDFFSKHNVPCLVTIPFLGNMGPVVFRQMAVSEFVNDLYRKLRGCRYGGVFEFMNPIILLRDPELIKMVTVKDSEYFLDHRVPLNEETEPLLSEGLISPTGHKDMESKLSPAFTTSKMKNMFVLINESGEQFVDFLQQCIQNKNNHVQGCRMERDGDMLAVEMKDLFTLFTNEVIAAAAFGIGIDSLKNPRNEFIEIGKYVRKFTRLHRLITSGYLLMPKIIKALYFLPNSISNLCCSLAYGRMITGKAKGIIRPGMIHLLMQAKKRTLKNNKIGEVNGEANGICNKKWEWDEDDLTAQVVLFFFAGFDISSMLLCFASHLLAVHPDVQTRLQKEIDETFEENKGKITYEAVHSMKYLDMVVSETLRLYPPTVMLDRKCIKRYTLQSNPSYTLNPGDGVWIPIYALHHDPHYFPNPETFDPERFSDKSKVKIRPFTYLPFGSGPRSCIGNRFALMEVKTCLVHLLSRFNLKVISKTPIPIQIAKNGSMTVDGGFWIGLEERTEM